MARVNPKQVAFVSGELSPRLEARDDIVQYTQGVRQSLNWIALPHGGAMHRSGSHFVAEVKDSSELTRLIPFEVSVEQAYVVEFGDTYARFYANEGQVISGTPVEVVTPYLHTELRDLQFAQEADVAYFVHPKHPLYKLSRTSLTSFTFTKVAFVDGKAPLRDVNKTTTTITVTGSGPYTLTASAAAFDTANDTGRAVRVDDATNEAWFEITSLSSTTVATADLKSGTAPAGATTDWSLGMQSDTEGFRAIAFHEGRLALGGAGDSGNVIDRLALSDSDNFEQFGFDFTLDETAVYRRVSSGQVNGIQWLASAGDVLHIGTTGGEFELRGANDDLLTPTGARVIPRTRRGSAHVQPVTVGESPIFLQRSQRKLREESFSVQRDKRVAADISILAEEILDSGGGLEMTYQQDPDSVVWIVRGDGQLVGFTIEQEQQVIGAHRHVFGGSFDGGDAVVESAAVIPAPDGSEDQLWVVVKRTVNGATKRHVEFVEDQFRPVLTARSTVDERINALKDAWFLDGALGPEIQGALTITGITQANPAVVSVVNTLGAGDQIYIDGVKGMTELNDTAFIVRNPTGTTVELETLAGASVDSTGFGAYISGGEVREMVDTITGLGHAEGETLGVLADGGTHPDVTVSSGSVTLQRKAARAVIGWKRPSRGETQRFFGGGRLGTDQGENARIPRMNMRVHNSLGLRVGTGPNPDITDPLILREGAFKMNRPPPLQSGDFEIPIESDWNTEPTVYWEQIEPLPYTILGIYPRLESHEG